MYDESEEVNRELVALATVRVGYMCRNFSLSPTAEGEILICLRSTRTTGLSGHVLLTHDGAELLSAAPLKNTTLLVRKASFPNHTPECMHAPHVNILFILLGQAVYSVKVFCMQLCNTSCSPSPP